MNEKCKNMHENARFSRPFRGEELLPGRRRRAGAPGAREARRQGAGAQGARGAVLVELLGGLRGQRRRAVGGRGQGGGPVEGERLGVGWSPGPVPRCAAERRREGRTGARSLR